MSEVWLETDQLLSQASESDQLLALHGLRRRVEPGPAYDAEARVVAAMTPQPPCDLELTLIQLVELIAAIDRRLPQVQRSGESAIANAAARLRIEAARRIAEIEQELAVRTLDGAQTDTAH